MNHGVQNFIILAGILYKLQKAKMRRC